MPTIRLRTLSRSVSWRESVKSGKQAVKEGKGHLQTGIRDSFASSGDPSGNRRDARDQDGKRSNRLHVRDEEDNGKERE